MARLAALAGASALWKPPPGTHPCGQLDRDGGAGWAGRRRGLEGASKDDLSWTSGPCFSASDHHIRNESRQAYSDERGVRRQVLSPN